MLACAVVAAAALSACADSGDEAAPASTSTTPGPAFTQLPPTTAVSTCGPESGLTETPGVLTIATDDPAYPPWFVEGDPANGKGFEGAVAREVATKLGFAPEQTEFVTVPFADALEPGPKPFDFDINQVTILGERRDAVDFSSPYYAVAQAVVAMAGTPAASADSIAALEGFRLGAQSGSTSLTAIDDTLRPTTPAESFPTTDDAKAALQAGEIDALVVDIPTGFQIANNEIPGSVLVGQFPRPNDVNEFFGLVLEKDSALTACVSAAVDSLYQDGVLDELAQQWLADSAGATVLE